MRDLIEIFFCCQTTVISFGGNSTAQTIKILKFQNEDQLDTLVNAGQLDQLALTTSTSQGLRLLKRLDGNFCWSAF